MAVLPCDTVLSNSLGEGWLLPLSQELTEVSLKLFFGAVFQNRPVMRRQMAPPELLVQQGVQLISL